MARGRRAMRAAWKAVLQGKQAGRGAHHAASVHVRRAGVLLDDRRGWDYAQVWYVDGAFCQRPCLERCDFSMLQRSANARKRLKMLWSRENRMEKMRQIDREGLGALAHVYR